MQLQCYLLKVREKEKLCLKLNKKIIHKKRHGYVRQKTGIQLFFSFLFGINKTIYRKELDVKILLFHPASVWVE